MQRIIWTFGLLGGAVLAAVMLGVTVPFMDSMDGSTGMVVGYTSMVLASLMIYFGIRQYRDTVGNGEVQFWQAVKVGLGISAVAIACYVITWEIVYYGFIPDFGERFAAEAIERARAAGATEVELTAKAAEMAKFAEMYKNPLINIAFTILEPLPVTLLFTFVSAGLLRGRKVA